MDNSTALKALGKISQKLLDPKIGGYPLIQCGNEAKQVAQDIFGYGNHHYQTLDNLGIYSEEIKKDVIYNEIQSIMLELSQITPLKSTNAIKSDTQSDSINPVANPQKSKLKTVDNIKIKIFIIHGHDSPSLTNLKNVLFKIGSDPKSFDDIPKVGSPTIIEILEESIPNCDAVIALLTPDDEGRERGKGSLELRARQNVLIEAGYGLISQRDKSFIIALGEVSIPSDFSGIYLVQDSSWSIETGIKVAKRLKDMGFKVDPSMAV